MQQRTDVHQILGLACCALLLFPSNALQARAQGGNKKASLSLKASPAVSFAPARVVLVAEVKGGHDNDEELYCPSVEWDWDDGTTSTAEADCSPYDAATSQVKRRYTVEHQYRNEGTFRVLLRLMKGKKVVLGASASIQVRPGITPES